MKDELELLKLELEQDKVTYYTCFELIEKFPEDRQVIKEFLFKHIGIIKEAPLKKGKKPVVRHFKKKQEVVIIDSDGEHNISTDEEADEVELPLPKPKPKRKPKKAVAKPKRKIKSKKPVEEEKSSE